MRPDRPSLHAVPRLRQALAALLFLPMAALGQASAPMTQAEMDAYVAKVNQSLREQHEANKRYEQSIKSRALWSTDEHCTASDAAFFEITTFADAWQIAQCAPLGCRIVVKDFPRLQSVAFEEDRRVIRDSGHQIRLQIRGEMRTLHRCPS